MNAGPEIRRRLRDFVVSNYLFGDESKVPRDTDSLMEQGLVDSTGILELIEFLEEDFGIEVTDAETIPENLGTIDALARYVGTKQVSS